MQILRHHIHKELQIAVVSTWPSSKGQLKVNIALVRDFDAENISVTLKHDTCIFLTNIMITKQV